MKFDEIMLDDLQECIDDCPLGKQIRRNMRTCMGLIYKYAIPRGYKADRVNLAEYLHVGEGERSRREAFTKDELELLHRAVGVVPYTDYAYCMCYLGFRPNEFLSLDMTKYNPDEECFVGGSKTEAGKNRIVTISLKIQPMIHRLVSGKKDGFIFCDANGNKFNDKIFQENIFAPAIATAGITRPLTPYCCRRTFATLMKNADAPDTDKLELIGHTSADMLRHCQHPDYSDLRRITGQI